jgi:hypothetical protein
MSATTSPADDSKRMSSSPHSAPITPALKAKLTDLNDALAQKVRDVVARKEGR